MSAAAHLFYYPPLEEGWGGEERQWPEPELALGLTSYITLYFTYSLALCVSEAEVTDWLTD